MGYPFASITACSLRGIESIRFFVMAGGVEPKGRPIFSVKILMNSVHFEGCFYLIEFSEIPQCFIGEIIFFHIPHTVNCFF